MTNVSAGGLGLWARAGDGAVPRPGDDIEVELPLDELSIRAVCRVAWTGRVHDGRFGFGVAFRELSRLARAQLERFLAEHRPRMIVAFAPPDARALIEDCLGELTLEFVDSLEGVANRSAAVVLFTDDADTLARCLDTLDRGGVSIELPPAAVTVVTRLAPERLPEDIYEVLHPPLDAPTLVRAAKRSCERWALELHLRWASLQLEGAAQRPIASVLPEAPAASGGVVIVRASKELQHVHELIHTVAAYDVPVLLLGETGTGKELAARELHALSKRAHTPFIAQDCGALIETLLESELFGHVRGAFTGATHDHPGLFQLANGGTIFLDEIQNTSAALQAKLLRVIEEGEVRPVGGVRTRRVDVRVIAACNVDLEGAVAQQRFRSDFYYRLNRFPIRIPALRDHADDIMPLARFFVSTICTQLQRPAPHIDPRTEAALLAYSWPGNIRELRNTIERSLLLSPVNEPLRWETLPDAVRGVGGTRAKKPDARGLQAAVDDFERELIEASLERNDRVVRRAAKELDVNAVTLYRRMKKLGIGGA
jgi:DNA-binding NtrC family response regulator